jgi:hypothetical protein
MKKPLLLVVMLGLGACSLAGSGGTTLQADAAGGSAGLAGNSGAAGSGGSETPGGSLGSAGASDTGGVRDTGGVSSAGGTTSLAGATAAAGTTSFAGATSAGGTTSAGGSSSLGGTKAAGGSTNVAGTSGNAGTTASGGATSFGGSTGIGGAKGGTIANGGSSNNGGATASGGKTGTGGSTSSGGAAGGKTGSGGSSSSGGATGGSTGGSTGSAGSTGTGGPVTVCNFSSGLNVAWVNFANDVPSPNLTTFNTIFKNTYTYGGRVIRWWFHTNGTVTPGYDSSGKAQKIPQSHIDGVKAILNAAATNKVAITISLWSFDMLQADATCTGNASTTTTVCKNNHALLEQDANRQAYVDNYLTPLVTALKGTPGLYSYEIFNEAEGMMQSGANGAQPWGWATERTPTTAVQKCVNWFAAAIHAADPTVPVTTGAQTFDYCSSGVSGKTNYYSDSALRSVGGKQTGTLDFYEVHYYTSNGATDSCFTNPASHWGLDKKLVMGEFAAAATDGVALTALYTNIYSSGYNGAWAWSYDADWPWPDMQTPMQNLYTAQTATVNACP